MKRNLIIFLFAIIIGIIMGLFNRVELGSIVSINHITIIFSLLTMSLLFIISFILPCYYPFLLYELFSYGYSVAILFINFGFKGIFFSLAYILVYKLAYWFLLYLNNFYNMKMHRYQIKMLKKDFGRNYYNMKLYIKKGLIISVILCLMVPVEIIIGNIILLPLSRYLLF